MENEQAAKAKMDIVQANPLYKYVKGVFTLIGKDGNSTLFLNDAGLHCKTNDICIKIQGFINGVSVFEELNQEKEYELCKLPGNIYRLSSIGFNEEKQHIERLLNVQIQVVVLFVESIQENLEQHLKSLSIQDFA